MKNKVSAIIVFSILFASACSHKTVYIAPEDSTVGKEGTMTIRIANLKDKKKKFDFNLTITNETNDFAIVMLNDIRCSRGTFEGEVKNTFFNTGERTIDFGPGQSKSANMVCNTPGTTGGTFKVEVRKVYNNPSHDRTTAGKVIAKDIEWKSKDL